METKSAPLVSLETNTTPGEFTAVISAIGNIDREGDRVMPMAFKSAMEQDPIPPTCWAHQFEIPPIGEGLEWGEKGNEIWYKGRLFVKGTTQHPFADMVYAGMQSYEGRPTAINQFSYTYGVPQGGAERVLEGGKAVRNLHEIRPVVEISACLMGINGLTRTVVPAKAQHLTLDEAERAAASLEFDFFQLGEKADWTQSYIDGLPDSAFLYVEQGGAKDAGGRTTPRELRHFPFKDASGAIDMAYLRKAIDNAPTAAMPDEKREIVQNRAQRLLRAQEGKALLLATIFSAKAWGDIEGYAIATLLAMLDHAVSYIQSEEDVDDVTAMRGIAASLIDLLVRDFSETNNAKSSAKAALEMAVDLYQRAAEVDAEMPSEEPRTVSPEIAELILLTPAH